MKPYRGRFTLSVQDSIHASAWIAPNSMDMVFIDGDHAPEAISQDLHMWSSKLHSHGILAGHDYSVAFPAVVRALHDFATKLHAELHVGPDDVWWFEPPLFRPITGSQQRVSLFENWAVPSRCEISHRRRISLIAQTS